MYSSIKIKKCKCGCGKNQTFLYGGYFYDHAPEEIKNKIGNRHKASMKKKNAAIATANKLRKHEAAINGTNELKLWFYYHMNNSKKECENCGADLSHYNEKDWYGSQDHIIEKSETNGCPSVASVLENHCVLGKWCCHSQKHTSNLNLSKMPIFPLLKERFAKFEHLIAEDERKKIPEIFTL